MKAFVTAALRLRWRSVACACESIERLGTQPLKSLAIALAAMDLIFETEHLPPGRTINCL